MKDSGIEWIGEIPGSWGRCKIKRYCLDVFPGATPQSTNPAYWDGDINWIPSGSCHDCRIDSAPKTITEEGFANSSTKLIPANTALVAMTGATCGNTGYLTIESCANQSVTAYIEEKSICDSMFLWYTLRAAKEHLLTFQTGGAQGGVNVENCKNIFVPYVPLLEQQRIAAYLDRQCAHINNIIEKTKASIEEYKKLRQAVITQAVTKGVRGERPMKGTGFDWLLQIPADWTMERGKNLFFETNNRSDSGEEELLTVSQYTGVTPRSQKNVNMFEAETLEGYKICEIGDIAANTMWLWAGAIGVSEYYGVISPSYNIYRQKNDVYNSKYLDYLLRIPPIVQLFASLSTGIRASRLRLYPEQFLNIYYPLPPMDEQAEIVAYLQEKIVEVDKLITKKEQFLTELETYKKSMIYEYVTGKKEVPQA